MVIAIHTGLNAKESREFINEFFQCLPVKFPEHKFYFLTDQQNMNPGLFNVVLIKKPRIALFRDLRYRIKLENALQKIRPDVYFSTGYISSKLNIPQCLILNEIFFDRHYFIKPTLKEFIKNQLPDYLKQSNSVVVFSEFSKNHLPLKYCIEAHKISISRKGIQDIYQPQDFEFKNDIRERFTNGKEFFMYTGPSQPEEYILNLLKAFSIFKKRQQSDMKLLLFICNQTPIEDLILLLKTYKYHDDVILMDSDDKIVLGELMGSAYAFICPLLFEGFDDCLLGAMKSGTAALCLNHDLVKEIAGDSILEFEPLDHQNIAEQLMLIYKNEDLRNHKIEKGKLKATEYHWETLTGQMENLLTSTKYEVRSTK